MVDAQLAWRLGLLFVALCVVAAAAAGICSAAQVVLPAVVAEGEPQDSLIRQLEPDVGLSVELVGVPAAELAARWKVSARSPEELTLSDPATGLVVVQSWGLLGGRAGDSACARPADVTQAEAAPENPLRAGAGSPGEPLAIVLQTMLANHGRVEIAVREVRLGPCRFRIAEGQEALRYRQLSFRNDLWYGSTYWTGPDWTRVGRNWHHPGENTPSVRRFACPRDGRVTITGRVYKAHLDGDGVRAWIIHGGRVLWQAELEGKDSAGREPNLTLEVKRGDAIRFVVHKRGKIFCDTTYWDPVVTYADGRRFQASSAFSARQGEGGWFYEMESSTQSAFGLPRLHALAADLSLCQHSAALGHPLHLSHRETLPLAVLTDGADRSGVVLASAPDVPWQLDAALSDAGGLRVELAIRHAELGLTLKAGQAVRLGPVALVAYRGPWLKGFAAIQELVQRGSLPGSLADLARSFSTAFRAQISPAAPDTASPDTGRELPTPQLDYWAMIQDEWRQEDKLDGTAGSYASATARHLAKAQVLLDDLRERCDDPLFADLALRLQRLVRLSNRPTEGVERQRSLYLKARWLKREIALANPLMNFGRLLFVKRVPTSYSHLVMQYFGWRARPGGGIFVLDEPGRSLACRDIFGGRLAEGSVLEPRLHWDGKRIVFSYVKCTGKDYDPSRLDNKTDEGFFHIYSANVDGTGLKRLTSGPYDDLMPTWLPDGGIAFCSTRRRGYARCFGAQFSPRWHVYTLHRMDADGENLRTLSFHDTNEWFPAVLHNGLIVYARWDYIDRDAVTHQNLWATRPDGTNPFALWGNATATPHCAFQAQPIPNSNKIVFTAAPHHSIAAGSIAIVDPTVARDGQAAITRITPEIPFPEAEGMNIPEYYCSPWPLSEKYFLVSYSPRPLVWEPGANEADALGLYLLDVFGNRELLYRDPQIGSTSPCPITPRRMPPTLASHLPGDGRPTGEMVLVDVYRGLGNVPRGNIKQLRVVQIFPKTTHVANTPPIGLAGEENGRAILGTVPIESDGSARFVVPAQRPILFQVLDQDGFAYQTMRSVTYVQPGETVACVGCHEPRMTAPPQSGILAMRRPASQIEPGPLGGRPFSYVAFVQPILDRHCVRCHGGEKLEGKVDLRGMPDKGFTRSYLALCGDRNFWGAGTNPENAAEALVPRFGARNQVQLTPPGGIYGALGSRLIKLLRKGHYEVKLQPDELARLAAWIDLNAIFYGVNLPEDQARQLRGELVAMPEIQ